MRSALAVGLLAARLGRSDGHGLMLTPTARGARDGLLSRGGSMWYTQSTTIGCRVPNVTADVHASMLGGDLCPEDHSGSKVPTINDPELRTWMAQGCLEPGTTIPAPPRAKVAPCTETNANTDWTKFHPWRAPGSAPTYDACGVAGASPSNDSNAAGGWGFPTGHAQGFPGSQLPPVAKEERDVWSIKAGTAEVAWTSVANYGGGYQVSEQLPLSLSLSLLSSSVLGTVLAVPRRLAIDGGVLPQAAAPVRKRQAGPTLHVHQPDGQQDRGGDHRHPRLQGHHPRRLHLDAQPGELPP